MSDKKPRSHDHIVTVTLPDEALAIGGLHIDFVNDRIKSKGSQSWPLSYTSILTKSYSRNNKEPKRLYEIYEKHKVKSYIDSHKYLRSFEYICAVDTNIKQGINFTGILIFTVENDQCTQVHQYIYPHKSDLDKVTSVSG